MEFSNISNFQERRGTSGTVRRLIVTASPLAVLAICGSAAAAAVVPSGPPLGGAMPLDHRPVKEEANAKSRADGYADGHISEVYWKLSLLLTLSFALCKRAFILNQIDCGLRQ